MDFRARWWLDILVMFLNLVLVARGRSPTSKTCEVITVPMCKHGNWNTTSMPNHLNHASQEDAGMEMRQFFPLVKVSCSEHLRKFLCSVYTPPCTGTGKLIPVCKSLCEGARQGCKNLMAKFGSNWPFNCDSSPYIVPGDQECIGPASEVKIVVIPASTTPTSNNLTAPNVTQTVLNGSSVPGTLTPTPTPQYHGPSPLPPQKCKRTERMTMSLCENLPWNISSFPNFLGHRDQREAGMQLNQFFPLVKVQCSQFLRPFLCAIYSPPCLDALDGVVLPVCRSLCLAAKEGCDRLMNEWGFQWPEVLSCTENNYIVADDNSCFGALLQSSTTSESLHNVTTGTSPMVTSNKHRTTLGDEPPTIPNTTAKPIFINGQCQTLDIPICEDIGWKQAYFPNYLGHTNQQSANLSLYEWTDFIKSRCSPYIKDFLCALYAPKCAKPKLPKAICRSLCDAVRLDCESVLENAGSSWPTYIDCHKQTHIFVADDTECYGHIDTTTPKTQEPVKRCKPISGNICKDVPWNMKYETNEAKQIFYGTPKEKKQFKKLLKSKCSSQLKTFVCSLINPKCDTGAELIPVCKSVCKKAMKNCATEILGVPWMSHISCTDNIYVGEDELGCIGANFTYHRPSSQSHVNTAVTVRYPDSLLCITLLILANLGLP